jgi:uncharacterized protein YjdB
MCKKALAFLLSVLIITSIIPVAVVQAAETTETSETTETANYDDYTPIYTKEDFYNIRNNTKGKYYLANDIIFTEEDYIVTGDYYYGFDSLKYFYGELDGCGHIIKGLKTEFGIAQYLYGKVRNLEFVNCSFSCNSFSNELYGEINNCIVNNCSVNSFIVTEKNYSSGIIENCTVIDCNLEYKNKNYPWIYTNYGVVRRCFNKSKLFSNTSYITVSGIGEGLYLAGFVYSNYGENATIEECINYSDMYDSHPVAYCAGIAGTNYNGATIKRCINRGNITGNRVAGITCYSSSSAYVENCLNIGTINSYSDNTDGYTFRYGISNNAAINCVNIGQVANPKKISKIVPISLSDTNPYNCYFLKGCANNDIGGTALTKEEMQSEDSFKDFDFENVWQIKDGEISLQMENEREIAIAPYVFPQKIDYSLGEDIDFSDMVVMEFNNKGEKQIVDDYTIEGNTNELGKNLIKISKGDNSFTIAVNVTDLISNQDVSLSATSMYYTGTSVEPRVKVVTPNGKTLIENKDYTVTYINNIDAGLATAVVNGMGYYTGTVTRTFEIEKVPDFITLDKSSITLAVGDTYYLWQTIYPADAKTTCQWSSSNTNVATIDEGEVKALSAGVAYIEVKTSNGKSAYCTVNVLNAPTRIMLNKTKATLGAGEKLSLSSKIPYGEYSSSIKYKSTDSSIATVSSTGVVKTKSAGKVTIIAETYNGKQATCTITVKKAPTKLSLNKKAKTLKKGSSFTVKAKFGSGQYSSVIKFTSSNKKIATVNSKGVVKAKKKGKVTITAKTYNGKSAKCKVTVK